MSREQIVRELAYLIWETEGRPHDKADIHWRQAETIVSTDPAKANEVATAPMEPSVGKETQPKAANAERTSPAPKAATVSKPSPPVKTKVKTARKA